MKRLSCVLAVIVGFALTSAAMGATVAKTTAAKPATAAAGAPAKATTATKPAAAPAKTMVAAKEIVDVNSASKEELMKLPGVGEATADKIIAGRPYKSKLELVQKKILNRPTYVHLRPMIVAKQTTAAK